MAFMDNYEGNKERTDRWLATFPQGRLEAHIIEFNAEKGYVLVQAKAWRNQTETEPAGIDYAYGYLAAYPDKMKRWMVEDSCTSALMRVMALVMGGAEKATQEIMATIKAPATDYDYGQQSMAMCRAMPQLPKPSNLVSHLMDHPSKHQSCQSVFMA